MPATYAMNLYRGDTVHFEFAFWDDPDKTQPSDLTGVVAKSEIRDKPGGALIIELDVAINGNVINVDLSAANAAKLPVPAGSWDLQLTYPDGDVLTTLAGPVNVTADVTDSTPAGAVTATERKTSYEAWRSKQAS